MVVGVDNKQLMLGVGLAAGLVVVCALGFTIRNFMVERATRFAHARFMAQSKAYQKSIDEPSTDAQHLIDQLYKDHAQFSHTPYGAYFLALAADIMENSGEKVRARETLARALKDMGGVAPGLYYLYATKYALMQLDAEDPEVQVVGKQALEKLANSAKNPHKEMALFYLGYRALMEQDSAAVQVAWGKLFDNGQPTSHWGMRAHALINYTA